jgi:hypothetical protein
MVGWRPVRWGWRTLIRITEFLDDYFGHPERPGVPARPGVMARLQAIEALGLEIRAETQLNGGGSMRDVVQATSHDVAAVKKDVGDLRGRVELFEQQRKNTAS